MTTLSNSPRPEQELLAINLKRDMRSDAPANWIDRLSAIEGVKIHSRGVHDDPSYAIVTFHATDESLAQVKRELGQWCNIERPVMHKHCDGDLNVSARPDKATRA